MKKLIYSAWISAKVRQEQRAAINHLAETRGISLAEAVRTFLDRGIGV